MPDRWLFHDDVERKAFLLLLREIAGRYRWTCWGYCVMGTHYHVLLHARISDISDGMRALNTAVAELVKKRDGKRGPVFDNRFFCVPVTTVGHARRAARYIVLNPVDAELVAAPGDWAWSSYAATLRAERNKLIDTGPLLELFGGADTFRAYVDDGVGFPLPSNPVELALDRPDVACILDDEDPPDSFVIAHRVHGHSLQSIADVAHCSRSTVLRQIQRWERNKGDGP